eukprot:TRINITY_DN21710_c0_g1_i1.p1 TRINITY_DN21710_c0_g1~~TRINITY_DN21710_c0_g1_i1.p1  ORF type:complete len:377 (+),score=84.26 TRINITY_DN21710_c0_g1_i1:111-1241(+)
MLTQLSQALQPTQELQMLQLQEREMELLRNNYNALVTASTLVMGFAYGGCIDFTMPGGDPIPAGETAVGMRPEVLITFYVCVATSMMLETYSACIATAAVVYGPDMAINGATATSTQQEVASVITRAIGGMRMAKHHIYGSFAGGLVFLLIATCLGTMDKIGYVERMGVPASHHKAGAAVIACIFGGGLLIILFAFLGMRRVFSTRGLTAGRKNHPDEPCTVCGDTTRDGLAAEDRRFLRIPCVAGGFKCYQCIGLRTDFTETEGERAAAAAGGCCSKKQPKPHSHSHSAQGGAHHEDVAEWMDHMTARSSMPPSPRRAPYGSRDPQDEGWDVAPDQDGRTLPTHPSSRKSRHRTTGDVGVGDQFRPGSSRRARSR